MGRKPMLFRGSAFASTPTFPPGANNVGKALRASLVRAPKGIEPTATGQTIRAERSSFVETVLNLQNPGEGPDAPPALPTFAGDSGDDDPCLATTALRAYTPASPIETRPCPFRSTSTPPKAAPAPAS